MAFLVETVRNLPLLLIIFFTYFALPEIGIKMSKMTAAIVALVIFESAMLAEIVRGGLDSVHKGQIEAARSSGLNAVQTMRYVILPQGMRRMVPPIVSQFISLLKDTSLAVVIALPELMNHVQIINGRNVNYVIPTYVMAALMYFVVNYALSVLSRRLESRQA
jgi:putative glutamine transport system permease protein